MTKRVLPKQIFDDPEVIAELMNAYGFAIFYNLMKHYADKEKP